MGLKNFLSIFSIIIGFLIPGMLQGSGLAVPWAEPSLKYVRIPVWQDGIYRISRSDLNSFVSSNGENSSAIPDNKFALFYRGEEVPLIEDSGDFLFFGRRNDGSLDSLFYPGNKPNYPDMNILSDSSFYFLTWYPDGRVGLRESIVSGISPSNTSNYYLEKELNFFIKRYFYGWNYFPGGGPKLRLASYQEGEGWTGQQFTGQRDFLIDSLFKINVSSGIKPYLEIHYTTYRNDQVEFSVSLGQSSPRIWVSSQQDYGVRTGTLEGEIEWNDIEGDSLWISVSMIKGAVAINNIKIKYSRDLDFGGNHNQEIRLPLQASQELSFSPDNFSSGSDPAKILCLGIEDDLSILSFPKQWNNANSKMVFQVNGLDREKKFWLANKDSIPTVSGFTWFEPRDFGLLSPNYIMITHESLLDPCRDYAAYRESPQGGSNSVLLLDFEEVRNQFSFGEFTPLGIRELLRFFYQDTSIQNLSLFLVGKGLLPSLKVSGNFFRFNPETFTVKNRVPTWGVPGSDLPMSIGLDAGRPTLPAIPVGRISVRDTGKAMSYFKKIMKMEDPKSNGIWRKKILHLSGGKTEQEIAQFFSYVNSFKAIAEGPYLGAQVKTFSKKYTNATENIIVDSLVNEGLSLVTLYGHSSVNFSDIQIGEIDDPNLNYNNIDGKLPFMIINGCYSGRVYESFYTWVENWALAEEKGASAILSHTDEGFTPILKYYTEEFYKSAFMREEDFGNTIGQAQIMTIKTLTDRFGSANIFVQAQNELMSLFGDPNIRLNYSGGKPNYSILNGISAKGFNGQEITSDVDSFFLEIPVANLGLTSEQTINLLVTREEPVYQIIGPKKYPGIDFVDTLRVTIPESSLQLGQAGRNIFSIAIDPGNPKAELDTGNNYKSFELTIPWKGVDIIYPKEFAIVSEKTITLQMVSFKSSENIVYMIELDTVYKFNSPGKIERTILSTKGYSLEKQDLNGLIRGTDTTIFYLRAKEKEDSVWDMVSFSYIQNSEEGWSQSEFGQYLKNQNSGGLFPDSAMEKLVFKEFSSAISLTTAGGLFADPEDEIKLRIAGNWLSIKGSLQEKDCKNDRFHVVRINAYSGLPLRNLSFSDPRSCGVAPMAVKSFSQNDLQDSVIIKFLEGISSDEYLLGFTTGVLNYTSWPIVLFDSLNRFGLDSTLVKGLIPGQAFVFMGKRGNNIPESIFLTADTSLATLPDSQLVDMEYNLLLSNDEGSMVSTLIGPSIQWKSLNYNFLEKEASDEISTTVFGINQLGSNELLFDVQEGNTDLITLVEADSFPYLFLLTKTRDSLNRSAVLLDHWSVIYDSPPDGFLIENSLDSGIATEVTEGEEFEKGFWFINHTGQPFTDSLLVRVTLNGTILIDQFRIAGPIGNDSTEFSITLKTVGYQGPQEINVFVNPFEYLEETYQNNFLDYSFESLTDRTPPLLSVFFDEVQIQDGDVVRNRPVIDLYLEDENPYLKISDPDFIFYQLFQVSGFDEEEIIPRPGEAQFDFNDAENRMHISYRPEKLESGDYVLRANGKDMSGNRAGFIYYEVQFRVDGYRGITNLEFFPNPFFSRLSVGFFLSGNSLPQKLDLVFYNRQGRKVSQIDLSNRIKLGSNRINDVWDGKGEDGLDLQGGLYFVKLVSEYYGNLLPVAGDPDNQNILKYGFGKVIYLPSTR
jgi:Peptidase family C25